MAAASAMIAVIEPPRLPAQRAVYDATRSTLERAASDTDGARGRSRSTNDDDTDQQYYFFLDKSYFFGPNIRLNITHAPEYYRAAYNKSDDNLFFEALPAMHIFFHNGVHRRDLESGTGGKPRLVIPFTMLVRLRQRGGFSAPVRSPSFMPRWFSGELIWISRLNNNGDQKGPILIHGPQLLIGHHSNGGAGCLFVEEEEADGKCVSDVPVAQRHVKPDGSFSTNYLQLGYWIEYGRIDSVLPHGNLLKHAYIIGIALEMNPRWLPLPGRISEGQYRVYGPTRAKVNVEYQKFVNHLGGMKMSLNPRWEHIFYPQHAMQQGSPDLWTVDASVVFAEVGWFRGWGLDMRYYHGQDFYNLSFIRDIERLQVGLVIDPVGVRPW